MQDLNKVQLIGHLGHDPDVRYLDNATMLTTFTVATNHSYTIGDDQQTKTEWHRCTAWGKLGVWVKQKPPLMEIIFQHKRTMVERAAGGRNG